MRETTRAEFYELVWSRPMTKVAEDFGLSDQGLAKICAKHSIPRPPRGYPRPHGAVIDQADIGQHVREAGFAGIPVGSQCAEIDRFVQGCTRAHIRLAHMPAQTSP